MSETKPKHTPGPWFIEKQTRGACNPAILAGADEIDGPGYDSCVASVVGRLSEMDANADLIAAAPDLLEALRDLLRLAEKELDPKRTRLFAGELVRARAAIAKAEGKS